MHDLLFYTIPSFLIVLGVVVFVHEWGHYIVARLCGVKVESFSLGFGPELFAFNDKAGTRWKVSLLPLGGYVKMFGDEDPSSAKPSDQLKHFSDAEKKVAFFYKPLWQRAAVVAAGPMVNFIFTFLVFVVLFTLHGQPFTSPRVGGVVDGSPAAQAGIQAGDVVERINNIKIERFEQIKREVSMAISETLVFQINRGGVELEKKVVPVVSDVTDRFGGVHKVSQIGIKSEQGQMSFRKLGPIEAVTSAGDEMFNMATNTLKAIGQIIVGTRGTEELGGPLRIAEMSGKVGKEGTASLVWFMAVISLSLGLFNLFPIPLLDGGHLLFYAFEAIKGKPLNESLMDFSAKAGFAFIIAMTLFFTWNDLVQLRIINFFTSLFT